MIVRVLDRLAGMTTMAIETINELHDRGGNINSLTEPDIDTTTPDGAGTVRHRRCVRAAAR
jgi:DNA invertase Pin-like site-specific DNA recombinase